jgi:hypothetical protein
MVGVGAFAAMAALYNENFLIYLKILYSIGVGPWHHAFIDSDFMYAVKACWQQGIDVYRSLPCDIDPSSRMAYSPLWMRLPFLPATHAARVPVGVVTDLLLLFSLPLLPPARTIGEAILMSFAVTSSMVAFALERNNVDVWMYLLIVVGVLLFIRSGIARLLAYGILLLAGLLKYYPLFAFGLALKERPGRFLLIALLSSIGVCLFIVFFWDELRQSLPNIPAGLPGSGFQGLVNLPLAFVTMTWPAGTLSQQERSVITFAIRIGLTVLILCLAGQLARRPGFADAMARMPESHGVWLATGCLVMGGCYAMAQNGGHRGVFLLIVLSGLLSLRRACTMPSMRGTLTGICVTIVPIMWMEALRNWWNMLVQLAPVSPEFQLKSAFLLWTFGELLWLNLERLMIAVLLVFALQSTTGAAGLAWLRRLAGGRALAES